MKKKLFNLIDSKAKIGLAGILILLLFGTWLLGLNIKRIGFQLIIGEITSILSIRVVKRIVKKKRKITTKYSQDYAFPSSHSSSVFLLATIISYWMPILSIFLFPFSFLIAYSRIKLGVHDLIDVIGGGIYGITLGIIMIKIF